MADAADQAPPPPDKKSGGFMGKLTNGIGIFVLTLGAVVVGGSINAKLHPMPDFKLDKDGKITAVAEAASSAEHGAEGAAKSSAYYAIDPPLVVNFEDGSVVRFLQISMEVMCASQKGVDSVQKNIPLIRNNLLSAMMSREGKEKLRQEALAEIRAVQKKQGGEDVEDLLFTSFVVQ